MEFQTFSASIYALNPPNQVDDTSVPSGDNGGGGSFGSGSNGQGSSAKTAPAQTPCGPTPMKVACKAPGSSAPQFTAPDYCGQTAAAPWLPSCNGAPITEADDNIRCTGAAYVMQGNSRLIGKVGFPNTPVTNGSAAVIPLQFTGKLPAGPTMRAIGQGASGALTSADGKTQQFNTFTDSVAEATLGDTKTAQSIIMARAPGAVVFEVVGGEHYGAGATFDITIPNLAGCPSGVPKQ